MSVVNNPNENFDNETTTHTPYEMLKPTVRSLYDQFMQPKNGQAAPRKIKPKTQADVRTRGFSKWFSE